MAAYRPQRGHTTTSTRSIEPPEFQSSADSCRLEARILPLENTTHFFRDAGVRGTMARQVAQFLSIQLLGEL